MDMSVCVSVREAMSAEREMEKGLGVRSSISSPKRILHIYYDHMGSLYARKH